MTHISNSYIKRPYKRVKLTKGDMIIEMMTPYRLQGKSVGFLFKIPKKSVEVLTTFCQTLARQKPTK